VCSCVCVCVCVRVCDHIRVVLLSNGLAGRIGSQAVGSACVGA
jgi:hypothetical protein